MISYKLFLTFSLKLSIKLLLFVSWLYVKCLLLNAKHVLSKSLYFFSESKIDK